MTLRRQAEAAIARAAVVAAAMALGGCVSSNEVRDAEAAVDGRLDPVLRRIAAERPDSVVGVLVRTSSPVGAAERAGLEEAGLAIGSVVGDVVTGRLRAGSARGVARLPFVAYVEAARRLRPVRSRTRAPRSG